MPSARTSAASATLPDGRTIIAGGALEDGTPTDSVLIFDPASGTYTAAGHLIAARRGHTASALPDGRVVVIGGTLNDNTASADVELLAPPFMASTAAVLAGSLSAPRTGHAAAALADGSVLIVGGASSDGTVMDDGEIVSIAEAVASSVPVAMHMVGGPRLRPSATTLIDNRVLIAGGNNGTSDLDTAELYAPDSGLFYATDTRLSIARNGHTAVLLPHNNSVLIAGGRAGGNQVATTDLFLPAQFPDPYSYGMGYFAPTAAMTTPRSRAVGGAGLEGYAFVAGGGSADSEQYRFATIKTDKGDYAPGQKAVITGSGWQPGEEVALVFQEDPAVHEDYRLIVTADSEGNIFWDQWSPELHDLGVRFYVTAYDSKSRAQITFTDNVTVTAASGGTNISADLAANSPTPQYTTLGDIVILENASTDFQVQTSKTLVLAPPSGWQFNAGAGTATSKKESGSGGNELTVNSTTVSATSVTVNFTVTGVTQINSLAIKGIQVVALDGANVPASGNVVRSAASTSTIAGMVDGVTPFAALSQAPGAVAKLVVTLPNQTFTDGATVATSGNSGTLSAQTAGVSFNISKITATDQFFNRVTSYSGAKTLSYSGPTAPASFTTAVTFASGEATALSTTLNKAETTTITVSDGTTSGPASSSITVNVGALSAFKVTAADASGGGNIGTQTAGTPFDIKVTAVDAGGNTVSSFSGTSNKVSISSTGTLSSGGGTTAAFTNGILATHTVTISDAGTFTITAVKNPSGPQSGTSNPFVVNASACTAAAVATQPSNQTVTYGTSSVSFTASATGTPAPTVQWQVSTNGGGAWSDLLGETAGTLTVINPTVAMSGNQYRAVFTNSCNGTKTATTSAAILSVNTKAITITPASGQAKVYGATDPTLTYTASPALQPGDSFSGALSRATGENVGSYPITLGTLSAGNNYTLSLSGTVNFTITAKPITITPASGQSKIYGASDPSFAYTVSPALQAGDSLSGGLSRAPGENVGGYAITLGTLSAGSNYTLALSGVVNFTITARPLTISADAKNKTYGDADPALTYHVTSGTLVNGDTVTGALTRDAGEAVGTYAINQGTLTAGSNYSLTFVAATLAIGKKSASVTPAAAGKTYGSADPTFMGTLNGFLAADSVVANYTRNAGETVGSYTISATLSPAGVLGNYDITFNTASFDIAKKAASVSPAAASKTYGSADPAFTGTLNGFLAADSVVANYTRNAGETVGSYTISATLSPAGVLGNYDITYNTASFDIAKKTVTGTFTAQNKEYDGGTSAVVLTRSVSDTVNGDSLDLTGGTAAFSSKNVGANKTVTLTGATLTGADAANYTLTSVSTATANITARTLNVSATGINRGYNGTTAATVTLKDDRVEGDVVSIGYVANFADKNVGSNKTVTVSSITLSGIDAGNYISNSGTTASAAITPRTLVVSATAANKVYDGNTTATVTLSDDRVTNDVLTLSYASAAFSDKNAGSGKTVTVNGIAVAGVDAANYTANTTATTTATITARPITVVAEPKNKQFGAGDPALTYHLGSGALASGDSFVGSLTRDAGEAVGTYAIKVGTLTAGGNYQQTYMGANLVIGAWAAQGFYSPVAANSSLVLAPGAPVPSATSTTVWNTSKGGSTIPLKFDIFVNGTGAAESTNVADVKGFVAQQLLSCSGANDDQLDYTDTTTIGSSLFYDGEQMHQNWKTPAVARDTCYRVTVTLQDSTTIHTFVKLRK